MDEGSGNSTIDQSGNGNVGTLSSPAPTWTTGRVGNGALSFNGSSNYVSTGVNNLPLGNSSRSAFAWIYFSAPISLDFVQGYGTYTTNELSGIEIYPTDEMYFSGYNNSYASSLAVPSGQWDFVGYTYSGGTSVTVYVNGQSQTGSLSGGIPLNTILQGSNPSIIGGATGVNQLFPGLIDDVRIYNRALSAAEIQALYNAEK
jgi:hypothetical protein